MPRSWEPGAGKLARPDLRRGKRGDPSTYSTHRIESVLVRCIVDGLAVVLVEFRLGIEAFDVADAAAEENPDARFRLGGEVRLAVGTRILGAGDAVAEEHGAEGEAGKAHAGIDEE